MTTLMYKGRELPAHYAELIEHAQGKDAIIIASEGWLRSAGVIVLRQHTDLKTMTMRLDYRSMNAADAFMVKEIIVDLLRNSYPITGVKFLQSQDELFRSRGDVMYFHAICMIFMAQDPT